MYINTFLGEKLRLVSFKKSFHIGLTQYLLSQSTLVKNYIACRNSWCIQVIGYSSYIYECTSVPQISSVSAYITQFKMPNTHLISFPGVSDTHIKFYFTQTFYIMRVIISPIETKHSWFSFPPLDCVFFSSHCAAWYNVYCIRM